MRFHLQRCLGLSWLKNYTALHLSSPTYWIMQFELLEYGNISGNRFNNTELSCVGEIRLLGMSMFRTF
jgi:hypothetical protein